MKSTDHNLNNPMTIGTIDLNREIDLSKLPEVITVTQEEYNLIQIKDQAIYVIIDDKNGRIYYGETLILTKRTNDIYLIGPSDKHGEYVLYLNQRSGYYDRLVEICRFDDPQQAITSLNIFNKVGSHHSLNLQIYNTIIRYINKDITLHEMIVGIISLFGYRDDIRLQKLIQVMISYKANQDQKDLPIFLRDQLGNLKEDSNYLFQFYSDLYDLVVFHNYFQDRVFHKDPENVNLSRVICSIFHILTNISE